MLMLSQPRSHRQSQIDQVNLSSRGPLYPGLTVWERVGPLYPGLAVWERVGPLYPGLAVWERVGPLYPGLAVWKRVGPFYPGLAVWERVGPQTATDSDGQPQTVGIGQSSG